MQKPIFDQNKLISEIIRVDHAGEFGAKRIYSGQLDAVNSFEDRAVIKHMYEQELEHLKFFEGQLIDHKTRPTLFMPFWNIAGYFLGYLPARYNTKLAMICTEAVEDVIDKHYEKQREILSSIKQTNLESTIKKFQEEELEHKEIAATHSPSMNLIEKSFFKFVKKICQIAIEISKKY